MRYEQLVRPCRLRILVLQTGSAVDVELGEQDERRVRCRQRVVHGVGP